MPDHAVVQQDVVAAQHGQRPPPPVRRHPRHPEPPGHLPVADARLDQRSWRAGGEAALASKGPGGNACKLDEAQLARLSAALDAGPAANGWNQDQRWTLARVTALIARLFHVSYTLRGASYLLHRIGFSPQVPARRAAERDEAAIAAWRAQTWAKVRG